MFHTGRLTSHVGPVILCVIQCAFPIWNFPYRNRCTARYTNEVIHQFVYLPNEPASEYRIMLSLYSDYNELNTFSVYCSLTGTLRVTISSRNYYCCMTAAATTWGRPGGPVSTHCSASTRSAQSALKLGPSFSMRLTSRGIQINVLVWALGYKSQWKDGVGDLSLSVEDLECLRMNFIQ
jgi:hypothetical protein